MYQKQISTVKNFMCAITAGTSISEILAAVAPDKEYMLKEHWFYGNETNGRASVEYEDDGDYLEITLGSNNESAYILLPKDKEERQELLRKAITIIDLDEQACYAWWREAGLI